MFFHINVFVAGLQLVKIAARDMLTLWQLRLLMV